MVSVGLRGRTVTVLLVVISAALVTAAQTTPPAVAPVDGNDTSVPGATSAAKGTPAERPLPMDIELREIGMIQAQAAALLLSDQGGGEVEGAITWVLRAGGKPIHQVSRAARQAQRPAAAEPIMPLATGSPLAMATGAATGSGVAASGGAPPAPAESAVEPETPPPAASGPSLPVAYVVEVDGETLLQNHQSDSLAIGVYGYVISQERAEITEHFAYGASVPLAEYEQQLRGSGIRLAGELQLPPGSYSLRLLVLNHQTNGFYLGRSIIEVPLAGAGEWAVLPPVFGSAGNWLVGRLGGAQPEPPLKTADGPLLPAARPVLVDGKPSTLCLGGTGWSDDVSITARLVDYQGRTFDEPEVALAEAVDGLPAGVSMRRATIAAVDSPPGKYRLVLSLHDSGAEQRATRTLPVLVVPEQAPRAWAGVDLLAVQRERTLGPGALDPRTKLKDLEPERSYHEALELLAQGDEVAARNAVAELERSAFAISPSKGLVEMRTMIMKTARDLADASPESLSAVIKLHHDLVHSYTVRAEPPLAMHAWTLTADLAELGCAKARTRECREQAADTLVSIACYLLDAHSEETALVLFNRALRFDPGHRVALYGLAVISEQLGEYAQALAHLERLTKIDPGEPEARLHLAVNASRLGHQRQAARHFRELTRSRAPRWVRAVAYQELAQIYIGGDRLEDAEKLLREAVEILPENQRLLIQLALVLDLEQRPVEAEQILERLRPQRDGGEDSPRLRYASWVPPEFTTVRHHLSRVARGTYGELNQSLDSIKPPRGWASRKKSIYLASPRHVEPQHTLQFKNAGPVREEGRRRGMPGVTPSVPNIGPSSCVVPQQPLPRSGS